MKQTLATLYENYAHTPPDTIVPLAQMKIFIKE